jgi:hypothetical protein
MVRGVGWVMIGDSWINPTRIFKKDRTTPTVPE